MILTPKMVAYLAGLAVDSYSAKPNGKVIDAGNDIRAVITETNEYVIVTSRGTVIESVDNWLTDFDVFPVYGNGFGYVPRGFMDATLKLLSFIDPLADGKKIITCGHSLGGDVAILLAASLVCNGHDVVAYAAFEPACSGEERLRTALKDKEGYISHFGNDPVPLLPPFYSHPCTVTAIGHDMVNPLDCHSVVRVAAWLSAAAS